jgi:hypothetical protein
MPYVPDASSAIRLRRIAATNTTDPEKKSAVFVAPLKTVISPVIRASDVGSGITPTQTVLAIPPWKSPQFNGRFFVK